MANKFKYELNYTTTRHYRIYDDMQFRTANSLVAKAYDMELNRNVCLKNIMIPNLSKKDQKEYLNRVKDEVRMMNRMDANGVLGIPPIYETHYDQQHRVYTIVMKWIEGETLEQKLKNHDDILAIKENIIDLCKILSEMEHSNHTSHKDIKPSNIMIDWKNNVWLIDFNTTNAVLRTDEGTKHYRSPEVSGLIKVLNMRKTDMFAIGVILYQAYTGVLPKYGVDYALGRGSNKAWTRFTEPIQKNPNISPEMNDIIVRCMKLNPNDRYANMSALIRELNAEGRRKSWTTPKQRM